MLSWLANLGNELITDGRQFLIFTSLKLFGLIECPIKPIKIIYLLINGSFQRCYSHLWFSQQRCELGNLSSLGPLQLRYLGVSSKQEQSYCVHFNVSIHFTHSSSFVSACDLSTSYLSSSFLYFVVRSSREALRTSSLDLNPAITSFVLSYFRWRSVKALSTAWRSSKIWLRSYRILSRSISDTT